jgi:pteridine reductase
MQKANSNEMVQTKTIATKVALITGGAKRLGAEMAQQLHSANFNVIIHYRNSAQAAQKLAHELNQQRPNSAGIFQADLNDINQLELLANFAKAQWQRVDLLINNASSFYPTAIGNARERDWDDLIGSNLKAPFFLAQALAHELIKTCGAIINIADIYAERPLREHSIYCIAKAGNIMLTKSLAQELAPQQAEKITHDEKHTLLQKIPLGTRGQAADIAKTLVFLATQAPYITGQIIAVDGGRSTSI